MIISDENFDVFDLFDCMMTIFRVVFGIHSMTLLIEEFGRTGKNKFRFLKSYNLSN